MPWLANAAADRVAQTGGRRQASVSPSGASIISGTCLKTRAFLVRLPDMHRIAAHVKQRLLLARHELVGAVYAGLRGHVRSQRRAQKSLRPPNSDSRPAMKMSEAGPMLAICPNATTHPSAEWCSTSLRPSRSCMPVSVAGGSSQPNVPGTCGILTP